MGIKIRQKMQRVLLIPLLLMVVIPFSLLSSSIASAANPVTATTSTDKQALSYWLFKAVKECYDRVGGAGGLEVETDSSKVAAGNLFYVAPLSYDFNYLAYGFFPKGVLSGIGDDGKISCTEGDGQLTKKALQVWGISGTALMCGMGYIRENGQSCTGSGSTNSFKSDSVKEADRTTAFTNYIKSTVYGGADPTALSSAAKYSFYSTTLINACTTGAASSTKPTDASAEAIYALKKGVSTSGVATYSYYSSTGDRVQTWNGVLVEANSDKTSTCKAVLDLANANFDAYAAAKACSANPVISGSASLLAACIAGASNKGGDINYCRTTFADTFSGSADHGSVVDRSKERQACYAGQGNAGADGCIALKLTGANLTACINGSNHKTDSNYCYTTYPAPDVVKGNGQLPTDTNADKRAACIKGQAVDTIDVTINGLDPQADCTTNPTGPGCTGEDGAVTSSCVIEGIGWIICPVFNFLAGVADGTYGIIQGLLSTDVKVVSTDSGTFRAWTVMRTFANIGFVIVFLVIIFSQLTSIGITNYGVKKLLPRLVVAAILVNLSFYVTQVAVDLSNILGSSLKSLLENISISDNGLSNNALATGNLFTNITSGIFAGQLALTAVAGATAAVYFGGAGLLIPILLAAVLAIFITLAILVARQALVILLVVVSPLAFLAMLLPNTENYFKQWRKAFVALLLVYPMIALLFGACHLASAILLDSFSGSDNVLGQLIALAVMVLPLFLVPKLLQSSLNAIPAIGSVASKFASRANGLVGRQSKSGFTKSTFGRSLGIRRQAKENYRAKKFAEGVSKGGVASFLAKEPGILPGQRAANKAVGRAASAVVDKADAEDVGAEQSNLERSILSGGTSADAAFHEAVAKGDTIRARAALNIKFQTAGGRTESHDLIASAESSATFGAERLQALQRHIATQHPNMDAQDSTLGRWSHAETTPTGSGKLLDLETDAKTFELADQKMAGQAKAGLVGAFSGGRLDQAAATRILSNDNLTKDLKPAEREFLTHIGGGGTLRPTDTPFH